MNGRENSDHPIILTLDLKDNTTDNRSFDEGNLAHLNQVIAEHSAAKTNNELLTLSMS